MLACTPTLFHFSFRSFRKHRRARERSDCARTSAKREIEKFSFSPTPTLLHWRSINLLWFTSYHPRSTDFKDKIEGLRTGLSNADIMFLVPNRLKELSEMRFEYLSNLIGKSIVAFLTGSLWRVLKSRYTGGAPEQGFQSRFADGLNQTFTSVCGADICSQVSQSTVWLQIKIAHYLNIDEGPLYLWTV